MAARPARSRGPRADVADTRAALLAAAIEQFAERGYEGARLRDMAAAADVDVALVSYHFGGKEGLFAAAMEQAVRPSVLVGALVAEGADGLGERLVRALLTAWDDPRAGRPFIALVRSAAGHERAAALLRGFVEREVLARLATAIDAPDPQLRAALCGSQLIGLVMARYVVGVEPIAGADRDTLAAAVGPTLQRYLTGALTAGA